LTYIYNVSFSTGAVPDLKIAKVVPIYKMGEKIEHKIIDLCH